MRTIALSFFLLVIFLPGCSGGDDYPGEVVVTVPVFELDEKVILDSENENGYIQIDLPGELYVPPMMIEIDSSKLPDRKTPIKAIATLFYAGQLDSTGLIMESWFYNSQLEMKQILQRREEFFLRDTSGTGLNNINIHGKLFYKDHILILTANSQNKFVFPLKKFEEVYLVTNELVNDDTLSIISAAFRKGKFYMKKG